MALWQAFAEERPDIAERAALARDLVFRQGPDLQDFRFFLRQGMSERAADQASDPDTAPGGIYGTGVWTVNNFVVPAVFVLPGLSPLGVAPIIASELNNLLPERFLPQMAGVFAVPLSPPAEMFTVVGLGAQLTAGGRHGVAGLAVRDNSVGSDGFLTAGHVAPRAGTTARDRQGDAIGTVRRSMSRQSAPPRTPTADVAYIERKSGVRIDPAAVLPVGTARQFDHIELRGQRGARKGWIRGLSDSLAVSPTEGTWGEVAITDRAISTPGDSGGPVLSEDGRFIIGHLVGGAPNDYSVVQDVEYQMSAINVVPY
jgi:hypothetical protein